MVSFAGFAFVTGFLLGLLAVVAAEAAAFLYLVKRLNRKQKSTSTRPYQDSHSNGSSGKSNPARKIRDTIPEETDVGAFSRSWSHASDVDSEEKFFADEGTLAWNLLISRLFFDVKENAGLKNAVHERIQRVLSNMRTPSYIGDLICCDVKIGSLPPYIHGTRILPMEMNGVWAFELDVEYTGGAGLEVQTRVDAREEDLQIAEGKLQPNSSGDVPPEFLEGLADFEKQLSVPGGTGDGQDVKADEPKGSKGTKAAPNNGSKWKSILKNIAEQVSQVPITLSIGVSSLRGTLRVHMKPPPSDQLWFGFTSMPEIEFDLVSSVGEHKITNSHVAMFLINRFKNGIREVMVLPNCESVTIPGMIAEKDDWVQRSVAPFMWLNQDSSSDHDSFEAAEGKAKGEKPTNGEQTKKTTNVPQKARVEEEPVAAPPPPASSAGLIVESEKSLEELKTPLLESNEKLETVARGGNDREIVPVSGQPPPSRYIVPNEEVDSSFKGKKMGTRERMFDFRKKVGEKFEEKKRHMEERNSEEKFFADEGTLAWNLLISRLFFDVKENAGLKNAVHERIQRVLSNMRTPSYIGDLICCDVKIGSLPPYIHGTRILPMEMNGVWAFELDVEYTGGAGLEVQTRVDAREEDLQIAEGKLQPNSSGDVPPEFLEGLADFEKQLSVPGGTGEGQDVKVDEPKGSKGTKVAPNNGSKWKSILKNIAEQVSQVPITLSIGVSSLRGTLRVHMKPPPSDQLWFGFTSMPEIEFDLVSSVGEHKITNSHVAMFLINRFKNGIREVMVLPNCESVTIPGMIAEKDDWVQRSVAPFMWLNQDSTSDHDSFEAAEGKAKGEKPTNGEQTKKATNVPQKARVEEEPVAAPPPPASSAGLIVESEKSLEELKTPLLESNEKLETVARGGNDREIVPGKKMGTRERMFDFRKKVGEKFEEKKRHMEERSRQIVEKMRGP
ncbi:hypothetical protein F2Q68_00046355 [Brassica cretica]|uniref:SMP-LTD domain-containing protein n=1 Tax=Brassica cretica TaxID=69181 RepID=A0A8S9LV92_BRACR|nr:hypothetical protein F2Q68_00046355 [Brassica cretica]